MRLWREIRYKIDLFIGLKFDIEEYIWSDAKSGYIGGDHIALDNFKILVPDVGVVIHVENG